MILAICCLAPFLDKAYTIDDPWFLLEAKQIVRNPFQPMSFEICWMSPQTCLKNAGSLGAGSAQALMGYFLVPVVLAGSREWLAHTLQILLACIAVIEMVRLTLWLGFNRVQAGAAGLLLVVIPPFLPMASTAMPDMLALTLGLGGMERLLAWKDQRRWSQAIAAGLMLGLAPWARPQWAMLLPLAVLWLFDEYRLGSILNEFRRRAYLWAPILLAVCVLLAANTITKYRGPSEGASDTLFHGTHTYRNLLTYFLYLAVPIPISAVWLIVDWRKMLFLIGPPLLVLLVGVYPSGGRAARWPACAALVGATALFRLLYVLWSKRDRTGLFLGLWLLSPLPVVFYTHFPIKYMMVVLPPAVLILLQTVSSFSRSSAIVICSTVFLVSGSYSCLILKADEDFAAYGRRAAADLIAPRVAAGEKVWYGGEWGFYWYAQRAGAQVAQSGGPGPAPGQLLAVGIAEGGDEIRDRFPNRVLVDHREYGSPHGRTMLFGAALYSNLYGNALWVWNPAAANYYELWRIQ